VGQRCSDQTSKMIPERPKDALPRGAVPRPGSISGESFLCCRAQRSCAARSPLGPGWGVGSRL
jgi:hypothetical protein